MKTRWTILVAVTAMTVVVGTQVMGQGPGQGQGWGPGPQHRAGNPNPGMGAVPHRPGPMGLGGGVFCSPLGPAHSSVLGPLAWSLNLTEAQIKQIRGIYDEVRANADAAEQAVATAQTALHEAVIKGATEAQIHAAATTLGAALGNRAALHAQVLTKVKAVLTEEQRKELDRIPEKMGKLQHNEGPNGGGPVPHSGSGAPGAGPAVPHAAGPGGTMTLEQMFKEADTNKDGVLTAAELEAFQTKTGGQVRHQ